MIGFCVVFYGYHGFLCFQGNVKCKYRDHIHGNRYFLRFLCVSMEIIEFFMFPWKYIRFFL